MLKKRFKKINKVFKVKNLSKPLVYIGFKRFS
nr:MAG TPA: hypothetical protein [Caudoviricetes sp.]